MFFLAKLSRISLFGTNTMFTTLWKFISHYGEEVFTSHFDKKMNRFANRILFLFLTLLWVVVGLELVILFFFLGFFEYIDYILPYFALMAPTIVLVTLTFWLKTKYANFNFLQLAFYPGLCYMVMFSLYLGPETLFHLVIVLLLPVPFFFFRAIPTKLITIGELSVVAGLSFVFYYQAHYPALYPLPNYINEAIRYLVVILLGIGVAYLAYYLGKQSYLVEQQLEEEKANLDKLYKELAARDEIMRFELSLAADIQSGILPGLSDWNELSWHWTYKPLETVSGDFIDVISDEDCCYVLLSDVSGHGVPAALITMLAKQLFSDKSIAASNPAEVFRSVNEALSERVKTQDYMTAFLLKIDKNYNLTYCNAGHHQAILISTEGEVTFLDTDGIPLGVMRLEESPYADKQTQLNEGDRIYLYTDGLTEQENRSSEQFGKDRLVDTLLQNREKNLEEIHKAVFTAIDIFRENNKFGDDLTLFSIERKE